MPAPENIPYYRTCADEYLFNLAPFFGSVRTIPPLTNAPAATPPKK